MCVCKFQSTHPLQGATMIQLAAPAENAISIHAPLAGCDLEGFDELLKKIDFNPRTPCRVRLAVRYVINNNCNFNPRTPCRVRLYMLYGI